MPLEKLKGLGILGSSMIFGTAAIVLFLETHFLIPFLSSRSGIEVVIFWFIVAGLGMFLPLLILAYVMVKREGFEFNKTLWRDRLRFRKMTGGDWLWCLGAIFAIGLVSAVIMQVLEMLMQQVEHQPPFMDFDPLTRDHYWILLVWLPYWLLNIMGEEILWRGTLLPRQEVRFGKHAWLVHGIFWGVFHIAFGWQLLLTLIPILFLQSYVVQRRKNSWIGVVIHAAINGPSFLAIAFGLL
ncbi:CPBP family intramembrane metalloprotease [candidate division KSB1 bacterium]|nr:CPBP family intramembrane metalloprotease [candidate division KSB1 bacterium]